RVLQVGDGAESERGFGRQLFGFVAFVGRRFALCDCMLRENRHAKQRAASKDKRRYSRTKNRSHVHTISCRSQPTVTLWGPERFVNRLHCACRISWRLMDGVTLTGKDVLQNTEDK